VAEGTSWRIETSFGWVHLRLRSGFEPVQAETEPAAHAELARCSLLFELEQTSVARTVLAELVGLLRGETSSELVPDRHRAETRVLDTSRVLLAELEAGRVSLRFEPFAGTLHDREILDLKPPPLPPAARTALETSFIAVHLLDQNGAPVIGRAFQIELPDGSIHRGVTDPVGFGRVRGFTQDGTAKVTFPGFDELDLKTRNGSTRKILPIGDEPQEDDDEEDAPPASSQEDAAEGPHFIALVLTDTDGDPLVDEDVLVTDSSGKEFEAKSDASGSVRVAGLAAGNAKLTLGRNGEEWTVQA
jgi:hypothetical protein